MAELIRVSSATWFSTVDPGNESGQREMLVALGTITGDMFEDQGRADDPLSKPVTLTSEQKVSTTEKTPPPRTSPSGAEVKGILELVELYRDLLTDAARSCWSRSKPWSRPCQCRQRQRCGTLVVTVSVNSGPARAGRRTGRVILGEPRGNGHIRRRSAEITGNPAFLNPF